MKLVLLALLLAGCASVPLPVEKPLVSKVISLAPVHDPLPVSCVKVVPIIPPNVIDPNGTPLQRYYQMRAQIELQDEYIIDANGVILGCAANMPPAPTP